MTDKPLQLVTKTMESCDSAVEFLCNAAEKAVDNGVIGVAVVTIHADGSVLSGWSGGDYSRFAFLGALEMLKRDFMELEIESRG